MPHYGRRKNQGRLETIPGFLPPPGSITGRCVFVDRCGNATDRCRREAPPLVDLGGRVTRCFYPERAPDLPFQAHAAPLALAQQGADASGSQTRPLLCARNVSKTYQVAGKSLAGGA